MTMTTKYQVRAGGVVVSEHKTEAEAIAACKEIEPQYPAYAAPSVVASTESGSYRSTQTIYPRRGSIATN